MPYATTSTADNEAAALLGSFVDNLSFNGQIGDQQAVLAGILTPAAQGLLDLTADADATTHIFARTFDRRIDNGGGGSSKDFISIDTNREDDWTTTNAKTLLATDRTVNSVGSGEAKNAEPSANPQDPADDMNPEQSTGQTAGSQTGLTAFDDALDGQNVLVVGEFDSIDNETFKLGGETGEDPVFGDRGPDFIYGDGAGNELHGGAHNDFLFGGGGNDTLNGDAGADLLIDVDGADTLSGGTGDDILITDASVLTGYVDAGSPALDTNGDTLNGDAGNDVIFAGGGDDNITGGTGNDWMAGGDGVDTFFFAPGDGGDGSGTLLDAGDVIDGFQTDGTDDVIDLTAFFLTDTTDLTITQVSSDVTIEVTGVEFLVTLTDITAADLDSSNFNF